MARDWNKYFRKHGRNFYQLTAFVGCVGRELRHAGRIRRKSLAYYLDQCGTKSLGIVVLICFLMGMILAIQSLLQMSKFGTEIFTADLVGFSILKELGPLMVAIIATGRAGSAFAAEIGTMKVDDEIDALVTMGIEPASYLVLPKLLAMLTVMPLLSVAGDAAGLLGGLFMGVTYGGIPAAAYWDRTIEVLYPMAFVMGILKSFVFAVLITIAGCWKGFQSSNDAQGVGRSATGAVVSSILLIVVSDMIMTLIYSIFGY